MAHPKGTKNVMRTPEEKEALILEYRESGIGCDPFAESKGISRRLFWHWVMIYEEGGIEALRSRTGRNSRGRRQSLAKRKSLTREEELELENLRLKVENERLKKGYAVKGGGSGKAYVSTGKKNTR